MAQAQVCRSPTLKAWVQDLTLRGEKIPIHRVYQRVIHPGLTPIAGDGFLAAQPGRQLDLPGSWAHCVAVLHWFERGQQGNLLAAEEQDSALGALLTLVTDRRCQVVPELFAKVENAAHHIAIPTYGQIDPALASPMPDWDALQRLKGQGLRWRIEGQPGLAEERVDEVGPVLDGPEPGADQGLELAEGGGGVVAQAGLHD